MKFLQGVSLLLLGLIHFVFLVSIGINDSIHVWLRVTLISSFVLLIVAYVRAPRSNQRHSNTEAPLTLALVAGATLLTFFVSVDLHFGPVIASAFIGLIASYIPNFFAFFRKRSNHINTLPAAIYCGTFSGMSSTFIANDYFLVSSIGLATGLIYVLTRAALNGVGGKLGTIAFGGVFVVSLIYSLL